jgi:hypothetical protein
LPGPTRLRKRLFDLVAADRPLVADLDQVASSIRAAVHGGSLHMDCRRNGAR